MWKRWISALAVAAGLAIEARAATAMPSVRATPVAWRGGYRYRSNSYRGSRSYSPRGSTARSSPLDYPPLSQPTATRRHQWNKYPNQPFYLRGERKSLLILP